MWLPRFEIFLREFEQDKDYISEGNKQKCIDHVLVFSSKFGITIMLSVLNVNLSFG